MERSTLTMVPRLVAVWRGYVYARLPAGAATCSTVVALEELRVTRSCLTACLK